MNLNEKFPHRDVNRCSFGEPPADNGIWIGYEGWGNPDIVVDPRMPLDSWVDKTGLNSKFQFVRTEGFLNCIHGDCNLTHAANGLVRMLASNGQLSVRFLSTGDLAKEALRHLKEGHYSKCQRLEKFIFREPFDAQGAIWQQTFLNFYRVRNLFPTMSCKVVKDVEITNVLSAEDVNLGATLEEWKRGAESNNMGESLFADRPKCIICERTSTKMNHDRRYFSRYCKNHYDAARIACDSTILRSYAIDLILEHLG